MTRAKVAGFVKKPPKHVKNDEGKPRFTLVPPRALLAVAECFTYGAEKYPGNDFRQVENAYQRYDDAARRHMNAADQGEIIDPESGLPHLAHAASNLLMQLEVLILAMDQRGDEEDE